MSLKDRRQNTGHAEPDVETKHMPMTGFAPQHPPVFSEEQLPFPDNPGIFVPQETTAIPQKDFPNPVNRQQKGAPTLTRPRTSETPPPDVPASFPAFPVVPFSGFSAPSSEMSPARPQQEAGPSVANKSGSNTSLPGVTRQLSPVENSPGATRQLVPGVTRQLTNLPSSTSYLTKPSGSLREPVIIPRTGKEKLTLPPPPPIKRRLAVHAAVTALVLLVALITLLIVVPASSDGGTGGIFGQIQNLVNSKGSNSSIITSQAATATAVTQDGFDAGNHTYAGLPVAPAGAGSGLTSFLYGQCTYWAAMRYHELTGIWVNWRGNANQWTNGAASMGWVVSSEPKIGSIIVLQQYVQGAGYYGHVAVVESINGDGSVNTSNWNWAGNWGRTTYVTFHPAYGVSFIYAAGH